MRTKLTTVDTTRPRQGNFLAGPRRHVFHADQKSQMGLGDFSRQQYLPIPDS
ncbi:hypothetical protein [Kocuria sp. HSID16901]|uniref:hypothetical protein n=1 Tax=Kocuria sp. HSID16901 TaxID=2419505 RepID=UPI000AF29C15|nr:hypothetical protein [Kocuria sp. HSID16901]MCT1367407.1 hypothetical protein [Rothia sp. p3-SID1597]